MAADPTKRNGSTARDKEDRRRLRELHEPLGTPCGICWQPIDYALRYPDEDSLSLDHIMPFKRFPELRHVPTNHQPAHLKCNKGKGERDLELPVGVTSEQW